MRCKTVAVIEDDEDIRNSIRDVLASEGYDVVSAENGEKGLSLLQRLPHPCVILVDLMMPVMNGWQFVAACGKNPALAGIPVVALSATSDLPRPRGIAEFVRKPLNIDRLMDVVASHCGRSPEP